MTTVEFLKDMITIYGPLGAGWVIAYNRDQKLDKQRDENTKITREMYEREAERSDKVNETQTALIANIRAMRHQIKDLTP